MTWILWVPGGFPWDHKLDLGPTGHWPLGPRVLEAPGPLGPLSREVFISVKRPQEKQPNINDELFAKLPFY